MKSKGKSGLAKNYYAIRKIASFKKFNYLNDEVKF